MTVAVPVPPLDGSLPVLPGFVDFHAQHNPEREWARLAREGDGGVSAISFLEFSEATHRAAYALRPDGTHATDEVVAVLINCDTILYLAMLVGLVRAGYIPFPMAPRNSDAAIAALLEKTSCRRILSQPSFAPTVSAVQTALDEKGIKVELQELPALHEIFPRYGKGRSVHNVAPFPASPKAPSQDDVVLYLHSSGSTGFPKPIPQRQGTLLQWCTSPCVLSSREHGVLHGSMALPTFHTAGIYAQILMPLASAIPTGLYAPRAPGPPVVPTAENMISACVAVGCTGIYAVSSFIEVWAQSERNVQYLKTLKMLGYVGGPLSETNGNKLANAGVKLFPIYGATECGVYSLVLDMDDSLGPDAPVKTSADWQWITFPEERVQCRWDPQGDGTYELQFITGATHTPAIENLPDTRGYATRDLFVPHPTKKGLWKIVGRKDDVLVLGTGEKVVPIPQEGRVVAHPMVAGAVMFGRGRTQCGMLVEPRLEHAVDPRDEGALAAFRNQIWHAVEEGNANAPAFARVFKEMIIVTDPAKPLPRAAKGTVVRPQALTLYADEIENLYQVMADSTDVKDIPPPASWADISGVESWLVAIAMSIPGGKALSTTKDLFEQGFDSLQATFLRNRIFSTLRASSDPAVQDASAHVSQNFVYDHPTLIALAKAMQGITTSRTPPDRKDHIEEIEKMVQRYTSDLPMPAFAMDSPEVNTGSIVVLLTGSTGNVGAHILAALLAEPMVSRVYTLNRQSTSRIEDRQAATFADRGLPVELLGSEKLVQLVGDIGKDAFGLEDTLYKEITERVTHIVHNAWRVDFNVPLSAFEPHISGVRRLIDFCAALPRRVVLLFVSSIAATHGWDAERGPVPEEVLCDPRLTIGTGYGESKFVTENLLGRAAEHGVACVALRVGQTCGSLSTGAWGTNEWVPILVKSSLELGTLPDLKGVVDWIPLDAVATAVVEFTKSRERLPSVLNVVHPHPAPSSAVFEGIAADLSDIGTPKTVPFGEWVQILQTVAAKGAAADVQRIPALKLLDFFAGIAAAQERAVARPSGEVQAGGGPAYQTAMLQRYSPSMRTLQPLGPQHAHAWVSYWRRVGFLAP